MKSFVCLSLFLSATCITVHASIPYGNSTWTYDAYYDDHGKKTAFQPGLFAEKINNYINMAQEGHKISQVFSYGGDIELYCLGSGQSTEPCTTDNMFVYYAGPKDTGKLSTAAYAQKLPQTVTIIPIVDGRLDDDWEDDVLKALNKLDKKTASILADKVAATYCADPLVAGVQFDIEPFDISQPGQKYFYERIADDFASKEFKCADDSHPQGRFFSIFTFSNQANETIATILNKNNNGYIIDSLYDLGPNEGGVVSSPTDYSQYVNEEIINMKDKAARYHIKYQFAVAGAASVHEFESKAGNSTGYAQLDYIIAAFDAIDRNEIRQDKAHFRGIDIWSWNSRLFWHGKEYTPAIPNDDTLAFFAKNL